MIKKKIFILMFVFLALFASCSSTRPIGKTKAEILYKEALEYFKKERYLLAIEKINSIKSQHPYSYYATPAELLHADILFNQENFVESAAAYRLFREFHPKHKKTNYVLYKLGESYFNQLPSTYDRDLSPSVDAIRFYQELIDLFPKDEFVKLGKERISYIKDLVLKQELYIAHFYFKTDVFDSARYRYLGIIKKYKNQEIKDLCVERIVRSSYHLKEFDKCLEEGNKYISTASKEVQEKVQEWLEKCRLRQSQENKS